MKVKAVLGVLLVVVLGACASAQILKGGWDTTIGVELPALAITLDSRLAGTYSLGAWRFSFETVVGETGWTGQTFGAGGSLGSAAFASQVSFNPATPAALFSGWLTTATFALPGTTIVGSFRLVPGNVELVIDASSSLGPATVREVLRFGDTEPGGVCDFGWNGVDFTADFTLCGVAIRPALTLTCEGFDEFTIDARRIPIPALPWLTLDTLLRFTVDEKTLDITPRVNFGMPICFTIYTGIDTSGGWLFPAVSLDGLGLTCSMGGIEFTGQSYWGDGAPPSLLSGTPYWEAYRIASKTDECCGPFEFDVTAYFDHGAQLFDVAAIEGNLKVDLADNTVTFRLGLFFDLTSVPSVTTLTLGFLIAW